jgi:hypothetical protein
METQHHQTVLRNKKRGEPFVSALRVLFNRYTAGEFKTDQSSIFREKEILYLHYKENIFLRYFYLVLLTY